MANALVVIDVQQYFLADSPKDLPVRILNHIHSVDYDYVAFTTFKNSPESNFVASLKWDKCSSDTDALLPKEFSEFITRDNVFMRFTYSAFKKTDLDDWLQHRGVDRLVFCGVDTDACVLATAFEAFDLGYHVKIDFDLTFSSNGLGEAAELIAKKNIFSRD